MNQTALRPPSLDEVAAALRTHPQFLSEVGRSHRLMYLHNNTPGRTPGFVKVQLSLQEAWWAESLRRESEAPQVLRTIGLPTPQTLTPYTELSGTFGLVEVERITRPGIMLSSVPEIATADPALGELAARTILTASGRVLVLCPGLTALKRTDRRNRTYATMLNELHLSDLALAQSPFLVGPLRARYDSAVTEIARLDQIGADSGKEYFVHNDATPMNLFFPAGETTGQLLDLEFAGATRHQTLAWLTDLGTFYGRAWYNPDMQQAFVKTVPAALTVAAPLARQIARLAVLTGATIEAGEHCLNPKQKSLVETLAANLESHLALI